MDLVDSNFMYLSKLTLLQCWGTCTHVGYFHFLLFPILLFTGNYSTLTALQFLNYVISATFKIEINNTKYNTNGYIGSHVFYLVEVEAQLQH